MTTDSPLEKLIREEIAAAYAKHYDDCIHVLISGKTKSCEAGNHEKCPMGTDEIDGWRCQCECGHPSNDEAA